MKAWLTPDLSDLEAPEGCRTIAIPQVLFPFAMGALELLANSENWEGYGTASPDDMAQIFMDALDETAVSECSEGIGMRFIQDTEYAIIEAFYNSSSTVFVTLVGDLPIEAQGASALYVNLIINVPSGGVRVRATSADGGEAFQDARMSGETGQDTAVFIVPNPARFVIASGADGASRSIKVNLVGWV